MFQKEISSPNDAQNSSPKTYDVMLTFDLHGDDSNRDEVVNALKKEWGFETNWQLFDYDAKNNPPEDGVKTHKLTNNTYLAKFQGSDYESKEALTNYLKSSLKTIFSNEKVKGKVCFLIDETRTAAEINGACFEF